MNHKIEIALIELPPLLNHALASILDEEKVKILFFSDSKKFFDYEDKLDIRLLVLNSEINEEKIDNYRRLLLDYEQIAVMGLMINAPCRRFAKLVSEVLYMTDDIHFIKQSIESKIEQENDLVPANKMLSNREEDVLKLLVEGKMNKEIADELFISIHTVVTHRKNISQKLGIKSTAAMAIYAVAHGIIDIKDSLRLLR